MSKWDGVDRRKQVDGKDGRRPADKHCPLHDVLWEHHEKDKDEYRKLSCGKISKLDSTIVVEVEKLEKADAALHTRIDEMGKAIVGKYWFRVVIGGLCAALIYMGGQNRTSNVEQTEALKELVASQKVIAITVNNIENKQIESSIELNNFRRDMETLTRRQDVMRDLLIRHTNDASLKEKP
jgi:hypothetical protein